MRRILSVLLASLLLMSVCIVGLMRDPYVVQGERGEKGERGEQGAQGEQGEKGEDGEDGKTVISAYELYCQEYGYTGSEEEWLALLNEKLSPPEPQHIYEQTKRAVVTITSYNKRGDALSHGSGFFVNDSGLLVTAHHVIEGAYALSIETWDKKTYTVQSVVAFDTVRDIALLEASLPTKNQYLRVNGTSVTPGEVVYSFGSSLGFLDGSFAEGVVASELRATRVKEGSSEYFLQLQYTAPVSSGNSGGPILNAQGEVIGIVTWGYTVGNSLNFATYVKELTTLDRTYARSVSDFYLDTAYYAVKFLENEKAESESNDDYGTANAVSCADSFRGDTTNGAYDFYKLTLTEESVLTLAFAGNTSRVYYPMLIDGALKEQITLEWEQLTYGQNTVFCTSVILEAGEYYVRVNGYFANQTTQYILYTHWASLERYESCSDTVTYEDIFS